MRIEARRSQIIELLERHGMVQVEELAQQFAVSLVTIRKDLTELEQRGLLNRTHGGATQAHKSLFNPSFGEKIHLQEREKQAIAHQALTHIQEGESIILDAGSTTLMLARLLKQRVSSVYVLTNSVAVATELNDTRWEVLLLGGQVRGHSMALIGPSTVRALEVYHADKVFLGATGVTLERGYSTPNPFEAQTKRAMMAAAGQVFCLVDSSKLAQATMASFAEVNEVDCLITDDGADPGFLSGLEQRGAAFELAPT